MVKQIIEKHFIAEDGTKFATEKSAERYEAERKIRKADEQWQTDYEYELDNTDFFPVRKEHLELLKRINLRYEEYGDMCGGICQDGKRPYGNSYMIQDINEITKTYTETKFEQFSEEELTDKEMDVMYKKLWKLHRDLKICGEILLQNLSIKVGTYHNTEKYGTNWVLQEELENNGD